MEGDGAEGWGLGVGLEAFTLFIECRAYGWIGSFV